MARKGRKKGDWVAIANMRARTAGPTHYRSIEECVKLPRKVRKFGNDTYPRTMDR